MVDGLTDPNGQGRRIARRRAKDYPHATLWITAITIGVVVAPLSLKVLSPRPYQLYYRTPKASGSSRHDNWHVKSRRPRNVFPLSVISVSPLRNIASLIQHFFFFVISISSFKNIPSLIVFSSFGRLSPCFEAGTETL